MVKLRLPSWETDRIELLDYASRLARTTFVLLGPFVHSLGGCKMLSAKPWDLQNGETMKAIVAIDMPL